MQSAFAAKAQQVLTLQKNGRTLNECVAEVMSDERFVDDVRRALSTKQRVSTGRKQAVYERLLHGKFSDLGCGDFTPRKIAPDVVITRYDRAVTPKHGTIVMDLEQILPRPPYVSNMTLSNLSVSTQRKIFKTDGIHCIPNHEYLLSKNMAAFVAGRVVVSSIPSDANLAGIYADRFVTSPYVVPSCTTALIMSVTDEDWAIPSPQGETLPDNEFGMTILALTPRSLDERKVVAYTKKYDGVAKRLCVRYGKAIWKTRNGVHDAFDTDIQNSVCLTFEFAGDKIVLVNVDEYRGMRPPNVPEFLAYFVKRKHLTVGGKKVIAPEPYVAAEPGVDGVIVWFDDYTSRYSKYQRTVDVDYHGAVELGYEGEEFDGIAEMNLDEKKILRMRPDKSFTATTKAIKMVQEMVLVDELLPAEESEQVIRSD